MPTAPAGASGGRPPRADLAAHGARHGHGPQELATNAVKYGSLSNLTGTLSVTWTVDRSPDTPTLRVLWRESGGPRVAPPTRRGFGTRLVEQSLAQDLNGNVAIAFEPSGVVVTITASLEG